MRTSTLTLLSLAGLCPSVLFLAGCSENAIVKTDGVVGEVEDLTSPEIEVDPVAIDFGSVDVTSGEPVVETVTVRNLGDAALKIHDLYLEDSTAPYTLSAIGSLLLQPKEETQFTVTFDPTTAEARSTRVLIGNNDDDDNENPAVVQIMGSGVAPAIELDPTSYDFGVPYIGCERESPLTIRNVGNADLVVSSLVYTTASVEELVVDTMESVNGPLPWTLTPGQSLQVSVDYIPLDTMHDDGYLTVNSNDPLQPAAQATQGGSGVSYGENLDIFEQPIRGSTDILWVIDNSGSMSEEQANLAANFAAFAAGLAELDADFHMAVITTDQIAFRGEIMTEDTPDLETEFISQATVGINGSGDERPTQMAYECMQEGEAGGPDGEFLRDDAMLAMIFVSDEPDSSNDSWSNYLSYFQSLKRDSDEYVAHAISGDWPSGCGTASATNNVYELTVATGGLYLSVCASDWSSHLEALVEASARDLSSFELSEWPVPETIEVRVNSDRVTSGWTYNDSDREVHFDDDHIPTGGSTIEIEYDLAADCEG